MGEVAKPELSIAAEPEIEYKTAKKRSSDATNVKPRKLQIAGHYKQFGGN